MTMEGNTRRRKRILVLHYSQTGQLTRAARAMMAPVEECADFEVVWEELSPADSYPFPWPFLRFFDVFPESVHMDPPRMRPTGFDPKSRFDLVVLAYQVWFLSPSLPATGFLKSPAAQVLKGTPVVTLIVCRNMWIMAQEKMKSMLRTLGAIHIDNIALVDQGHPLATFVTMPRWLLTGKKNGFWGIFPPAGVRESDIEAAARFGRAIVDAMRRTQGPLTGPCLTGLGAVKVNPGYIASEKIAHRSFFIWGKLLRGIGAPGSPQRRALLMVYVVFLIAMILTVVPLGIAVRALLKPLFKKRLGDEVARLEGPSGSSTERVARYA